MVKTPQAGMEDSLDKSVERHKETLDKFRKVSSRTQEENLTIFY
jgi:hypothetical protein